MADEKHPPPQTYRISLGDSVDGVDVAQTLMTDKSRDRSLELRWKQLLKSDTATAELGWSVFGAKVTQPMKTWENSWQVANDAQLSYLKSYAPETYVVRYYITDAQTTQISNATKAFLHGDEDKITTVEKGKKVEKDVPYLRADNPAGPVNENMARGINDAFSQIDAQLPGRFRFVRVTNPAEADISFAAVPKIKTKMGVTDIETNAILLNSDLFKGSYNSIMPHAALHEIGHAMGLAHPQNHQKGNGAPSTDKATFFDTVMTYDTNNDASPEGSNYLEGYTVSLMPADIKALLTLYPIAQDRRAGAVLIANAAGVKFSPDAPVTVDSADSPDKHRLNGVMFPERGSVFQPVPDSKHDVVTVGNHSIGAGKSEDSTVYLRQVENGLAITKPGGFLTGGGTTFMPLHAERIELSSGWEEVTTRGNVDIYSPKNTATVGEDKISLNGKNNHVSMSAEDITKYQGIVEANFGSQSKVTLRDMDQFDARQLDYFINPDFNDKKLDPTKLKSTWKRNDQGAYELNIYYPGRPADTASITFVLENPTQMDRAKFEAALSSTNLRVLTNQLVKNDKGEMKVRVSATEVPVQQAAPKVANDQPSSAMVPVSAQASPKLGR